MSSTVTTATVATMTAAVTLRDLSQILTLIALVSLVVFLVAKEISAVSTDKRIRALARGLDLGVAPFLIAFLVMVGVNMAGLFQD